MIKDVNYNELAKIVIDFVNNVKKCYLNTDKQYKYYTLVNHHSLSITRGDLVYHVFVIKNYNNDICYYIQVYYCDNVNDGVRNKTSGYIYDNKYLTESLERITIKVMNEKE